MKERTAAEWFAARHAPHDAALDQRFADWLAENPNNAANYSLCELTWELASTAAVGLEEQIPPRERWYRSRLIGAVVAAAAACIVLTAVGLLWFAPTAATQWSTAPGEQRIVTLADGSHITLNTRTRIEVRLTRSTRDIRLLQGEAFFDVAKDPSRPFVVETSFGTARAVGTRFDVLLESQRAEVSTQEGKVWVQAPDHPDHGVLSTAGMRATLVANEARPALDRADLTRIENWRARRLEFDRVPLSVALTEFSRYTDLPIRPASAEVGQMYITAVLKAGDVEALSATLNGAFGLRLEAAQNEWLVRMPAEAKP